MSSRIIVAGRYIEGTALLAAGCVCDISVPSELMRYQWDRAGSHLHRFVPPRAGYTTRTHIDHTSHTFPKVGIWTFRDSVAQVDVGASGAPGTGGDLDSAG